MPLPRRDEKPDFAFLEVSMPADPGPIEPPGPEADGNSRTFHAWARADAWRQVLEARFPDPPAGAAWAADVFEREFQRGAWPDGAQDFCAVVSVGVLYDPQDPEARRFAEVVGANRPNGWTVEGAVNWRAS